jgi:hypothetical protein
MSIQLSDGGFGDIEAALLRAGLGRQASAEFAEHIIDGGVYFNFKASKLREAGIDPEVLVRELRAVGLRVRWGGEKGEAP